MDDRVKPRDSLDPLDVNRRLYMQIANLLTDMENPVNNITIRERIAALVAVARIQTLFVGLRKETHDDGSSGSAVKRYAAAFAKNASGKSKKRSGAAAAPEPDPFESGDWDDDGGEGA